jgi:hypothetical protein
MAKRVLSVFLAIVAVVIVASVLLFETNAYVNTAQYIEGTSHSHTFTVSLEYSGPWKLSYLGYTALLGVPSGQEKLSGANVTLTGSGLYSRSITLSGPDNEGLSLCASAQKLDASNATMVLTVTGHNETSLPYGSVFTCGYVEH